MPLRSCVVCRDILPKLEITRIVHTKEGTIKVDPTGKVPGRGAYICTKRQCWKQAMRKNRLGHALKKRMSIEDEEQLLLYSQAFLGAMSEPT